MSSPDDERLARIALSRLGEPGSPKLLGLIDDLGAVEVRARLLGQREIPGVSGEVAGRLADLDPEVDLERAHRLGIRYVIPGDDEWPPWLDDLAHSGEVAGRGGAPLGLWVKGPLRLDRLRRSLAVVGSRSATTYGADIAGQIAAEVAQEGFCVVSGAAYGIDQAAHRGALAVEGQTVAVMATGMDRVYPAAHTNLVRWIGEHGAVVSELPFGSAVMRHRLLARNRIVAALSMGTVVVEAAIRSGALNTANWTQSLSRPLMGVPGPVTSEASSGVHQLIRTGAGALVTRGAEVLELVGGAGAHLVPDLRAPERPRDRLSVRQAQVLDAVPAAQQAQTESIARVAGMSLATVLTILEELLDQEFVTRGEDGWQLSEMARC